MRRTMKRVLVVAVGVGCLLGAPLSGAWAGGKGKGTSTNHGGQLDSFRAQHPVLTAYLQVAAAYAQLII